jgi:hypothetical protein
VGMFVGVDPIHRKARTREELEAVMNEPRGVSPTREVWMHESLVDAALRLWEQMVRDPWSRGEERLEAFGTQQLHGLVD